MSNTRMHPRRRAHENGAHPSQFLPAEVSWDDGSTAANEHRLDYARVLSLVAAGTEAAFHAAIAIVRNNGYRLCLPDLLEGVDAAELAKLEALGSIISKPGASLRVTADTRSRFLAFIEREYPSGAFAVSAR